jgi:hypothetical protein
MGPKQNILYDKEEKRGTVEDEERMKMEDGTKAEYFI